MRKSLQELRDDFNKTGFEFLMADLDTATAFIQRALQSHNPVVKRRNSTNARKGYDTVVRLRKKVELDCVQQSLFDEKMLQVLTLFEQLGEQFSM